MPQSYYYAKNPETGKRFRQYDEEGLTRLLQSRLGRKIANYKYVKDPSSGKKKRQYAEGYAPALRQKSSRGPRAPSAYNLFMKGEIPKVRASNPGLTSREVFAMVARNWKSY